MLFISLLVLEAIVNMRYGDCSLQILLYGRGCKMEMLQLCGHPVVGREGAPLGIFGLWPIQVPQFEPEVILLAVVGSSRFSLSYRDVEELLSPSVFARRSRHGAAM
jgi:hypothetical protein